VRDVALLHSKAIFHRYSKPGKCGRKGWRGRELRKKRKKGKSSSDEKTNSIFSSIFARIWGGEEEEEKGGEGGERCTIGRILHLSPAITCVRFLEKKREKPEERAKKQGGGGREGKKGEKRDGAREFLSARNEIPSFQVSGQLGKEERKKT